MKVVTSCGLVRWEGLLEHVVDVCFLDDVVVSDGPGERTLGDLLLFDGLQGAAAHYVVAFVVHILVLALLLRFLGLSVPRKDVAVEEAAAHR